MRQIDSVLFMTIIVGYVIVVCVITIGLAFIFVSLIRIESSKETLKEKNLLKYKYMFAAIKESIMVITDSKVSYVNSQALKLFTQLQFGSSVDSR